MALIYQFGTNPKQKKTDLVFSAENNGDFTVTVTATDAVKVIRASKYSHKRYNCFDSIVTDILKEYPSVASVYFTEAAAQAIANLVTDNQRKS